MIKRAIMTGVGLLCWLGLGQSFAATYSGPMETTRWQVDASVFACRMHQDIPLLGEAAFARRAGESQHFYLTELNRQLKPGNAELLSLTPRWRAIGQHYSVRPLPIGEGDVVSLDWRESQQLLQELVDGRQLLVRGDSWYESDTPVNVVIEPIRFRQALSEYQSCLAGLLPVNYDQVRRTSVHFPGGTEEFDDIDREVLDNLARYVLADAFITALVIDGHTDGLGLRSENLELSQKRAEFVVAYLTERGIPEDLIEVRWHGERYPIATNRTPTGRAQNRRVTIRVDRFEPDPETLARAD
ncbi:OmpA family protein [Gilvimarinus sp. SDUM040013]|uniref:OmpA family protein n=1 Tax=Gilvimarinus gilvus TaxID=3058038 RepID=A0ABU4RVR5_9GAMM|nr:OmpA family protein [Gilvimarinus sp. SDUM040013]MDO3388213.1 OmpA family protein [Gilvimarinus sp. SDUM040013]MDX6847763.1 OmpA family protein [Gilvimarinus sp. SDUM040013]